MKKIKEILERFNPLKDKYISREYQSFGIFLAQKLGEEKSKSKYIRMAKYIPRPILEKALSFVSDSNARSKGALFMWKLKEFGTFEKYKITSPAKKPKNKEKKTKSTHKPTEHNSLSLFEEENLF